MVDLRTVFHEEALDTGELVGLSREYDDVEIEVREIGPCKLETAGII